MASDVMKKFQDEVLSMALEKLNKVELADRLAVHFEKEMRLGISRCFDDEFDISDWLMEELNNSNTPAGKAFDKALASIAKRMAEAAGK